MPRRRGKAAGNTKAQGASYAVVLGEALRDLGASRRQTEVALGLAKGESRKEVAGVIGISERTLAVHLERLFLKTGVHAFPALLFKLNEMAWHRRRWRLPKG